MRTLQATVYIRVLGFVGDIIYSSYDGVRRLLARWKDERKKWLRRSEATKRGFNQQGPRDTTLHKMYFYCEHHTTRRRPLYSRLFFVFCFFYDIFLQSHILVNKLDYRWRLPSLFVVLFVSPTYNRDVFYSAERSEIEQK